MAHPSNSLCKEQVLAISLNHTIQQLQNQRMALSKKMNDTKAKFQEAKKIIGQREELGRQIKHLDSQLDGLRSTVELLTKQAEEKQGQWAMNFNPPEDDTPSNPASKAAPVTTGHYHYEYQNRGPPHKHPAPPAVTPTKPPSNPYKKPVVTKASFNFEDTDGEDDEEMLQMLKTVEESKTPAKKLGAWC